MLAATNISRSLTLLSTVLCCASFSLGTSAWAAESYASSMAQGNYESKSITDNASMGQYNGANQSTGYSHNESVSQRSTAAGGYKSGMTGGPGVVPFIRNLATDTAGRINPVLPASGDPRFKINPKMSMKVTTNSPSSEMYAAPETQAQIRAANRAAAAYPRAAVAPRNSDRTAAALLPLSRNLIENNVRQNKADFGASDVTASGGNAAGSNAGGAVATTVNVNHVPHARVQYWNQTTRVAHKKNYSM